MQNLFRFFSRNNPRNRFCDSLPHLPGLGGPFLSELLSPFLPVNSLTMMQLTFGAAELLTGTFEVEEVSAFRIRTDSKAARIDKLAP
jgi:hypothetical protein